MTDDQALQALAVFGFGSALGALLGGVKGFQVGVTISGAIVAERLEPGKGVELICKALGIAPPAPDDQTVHDAIPVFDDEPSLVRKMLLLGEGLNDGGAIN